MTVDVQREQHQQQRPPQPAPDARANRAQAAEQRNAAAAVKTAVTVAQVERTRARHLGADGRRLAEALQILFDQIEGREDMTVLEPGNVLRWGPGVPEAGTAHLDSVIEYVGRILGGELPHDAIEEMHEQRLARHLSGAARHADAMYERAHRLENAAMVQPALPAAAPPVAAPQSSNGHVALPQRQVPPAPPEKPTERTGQIALAAIQEKIAQGHDMTASEAKLVEHGYAGPDYGPAPAKGFSAAALPQMRMDDTQRMIPVYEFDVEADGPAGEVEAEKARLPFAPAASTAASTSSPQQAGGSGGGDDD